MKKLIILLCFLLFISSAFADKRTIFVEAYTPDVVKVTKTTTGLKINTNSKKLLYYFSDFDGNTTPAEDADLLNLFIF